MERHENRFQKVGLNRIFQRIFIAKIDRRLPPRYRYASLYFCCAVDRTENELITLEVIHRYVELLDKYFGSVRLISHCIYRHWFCFIGFQVCELDIIFNFEKAYFILDEFLIGGQVQETNKKMVLKAISAQDMIQEVRRVVFFIGREILKSQFATGNTSTDYVHRNSTFD